MAAVILPARAEDSYVKRGTPQRQGRVWVEQAECSVPVKEGGRLVLRTDLGSVSVRPGASDRLQCSVGGRAPRRKRRGLPYRKASF
jgi:hypothetical protein